MLSIPTDSRETQFGEARVIQLSDFCRRDIKFTTNPLENTPHYLPFIFQGASFADQEPDLQRVDGHITWLVSGSIGGLRDRR